MADKLLEIVQYILGFGPTVMLPVVIFIMALCLGVKIGRAIRSSLTIGMGFVGIFVIFDLLGTSLSSATTDLVEHAGIDLPVIDLGWPPLAAIAWASPIAPFVIPMTIIINIVMLTVNWTKTVDIDLWNFWHFTFVGALVYSSTGSFVYGLIIAGVTAVITFVLADWCAPMIQKYFELPGISLPTLSSVIFFPIGVLGNLILDKIPGLQKLHADPQTIQKRFGIFGEPMMIGFVIGGAIGIAAGYDVKGILNLAINLGAVMLIMPRMVKLLMEGLLPLSDAVKQFLNKKFPNRKNLYIGLDIAVAVGHPSVLSTALLLIPVGLILSIILPGNRLLPLGDLTNIWVPISMVVLACRGNIVRSFIIGIPCLIVNLYVASAVAPIITNIAKSINFPVKTDGEFSSLLDGGNPYRFWAVKVFEGNYIALALIPIIFITCLLLYRHTKKTWDLV
ncbi:MULTISPECIES: PTS galactitol transporter subunit IIC [unclassified Gilliamella]|uniref:PTS galactitol transporter subunit IIC n=1 Tax=unclassified Gilliamella TaxID=2685620 RepID=UPI002269D0C9|nr:MULTISPECIES: PTS transporter subunit IIC [unclassified Gilliamella]MCX8595854.1 PTS galactitol transporter subunit IIC [Gilliamella sp. B3493]MCX8598052.1 PTS galactitol transporter subunit IIC [Gilliamella sp. B3486]MCX8688797.1 PTS galactitol transporter subunit IIC [Gilliamella sp. B2973]MCX8704039.1 PTS galactitol transporter subunit IIC [Gilliamella sp. B3127]